MLTRKMKDSGVEWIGEIPENWEVRKLGNLSNLYTGNSIKDNEKDNYTDNLNSIPYIATKDVNNNHTINYKNGMYVKEDDLSFKIALKDSTLICIEGGSAGTKIAYLNQDVTFGNKLCAVYSEFVSNEYLYYYILSPCFNNSFNSRITGLIPGVTLSEMSKIEVVIPPATKQYKIVKALDEKVTKIADLQSETHQSIEELKKYKQSLITEAVTKGLYLNVEMKDSGIEWIGNIPEDWKLTRLKFLLKSNLLYGANESGIPYSPFLPRFIRITDIVENNKLTSDNKLSLSIERAENYLLKEGDILFARSGASVGKTFLVESQNTNDAFAGYLIKASFKNNVISKFVYYYTLSSAFEAWKNSIKIQSTIQNIGADKYNNLLLPIPSKYIQQEIVSYLDEQTSRIDKLIEDKTKLFEELEAYKKSLIYEYVTGEKEV